MSTLRITISIIEYQFHHNNLKPGSARKMVKLIRAAQKKASNGREKERASSIILIMPVEKRD